MQKGHDVICKSLLHSLVRLENNLTAPEAEHSFDVSSNAECHERLLELRRLKRSLEQYSTKDSALTYVGLLGTFPLESLITINSLLNQSGSSVARLTGLHPTDKAVTLITHPCNSQSLIGMHRRGELEVGSSLVESALLKEVVLVDTPGSGDPLVLEEMVRDFLPICDWIIYVFSAAVTLDSTDLPTLRKAHADLPFIQIKFLITRADEFKRDRNAPLEEANFDQKRADQFIAEFISRLAASVPGKSILRNEVFLIDNLHDFRVDSLMSLIADSRLKNSPNDLHIHKIAYFLRSAKNIKEFYESYLEKKIHSLRGLLSTAQENHQNYQETVLIANNRLTESWLEQRHRLNQVRNKLSEWTSNISPFGNLPTQATRLEIVTNSLTSIQQDLKYWAESKAETLCRSLKSRFSKALSERIHGIADEISMSKNWEQIEISGSNMSIGGGALVADLETRIPERDRLSAEETTKAAAEELHRKASHLMDSTGLLAEAVNNRSILGQAHELIEESSEQISEMLNGFFKSVQVYKTAILAINARELAQQVGIVQAIDKLEQVHLADAAINNWKKQTISAIFFGYNEKRQELEGLLNDQFERLSTLRTRIKRPGGQRPT